MRDARWCWVFGAIILASCNLVTPPRGGSDEPGAPSEPADPADPADPPGPAEPSGPTQPLPSPGRVVLGSITVRTAADLAALTDVAVIGGSLIIDRLDVSAVVLARLVRVGGRLTIRSQTLVTLKLPALEEVDDDMNIDDNKALTTIDAPRLQRVGGLSISENPVLPDLRGLSALTAVDRDIKLSGNAKLVSAYLPIRTVGGDVTVLDNSALVHIAWSLAGPVGNIDIGRHLSLDTVDVTVSGDSSASALNVHENYRLDRVSVNAQHLGSVLIENNSYLTEILVMVERVDGDMTVQRNDKLNDLSLSATSPQSSAVVIGGALWIAGPIQTLHSAQPLEVEGNCTITDTHLVAVDDGSRLTRVGGMLGIWNNASLVTISPISLGGGLTVLTNAVLSTLAFVSQSEIHGNVAVGMNPALRDLGSFESLTQIRGYVQIYQNPRLPSCAANALSPIVVGTFSQFGNDDTASCAAP